MSEIKVPVFEALPPRFQARIEQRNRSLRAAMAAHPGGFAPHFILSLTKKWKPGQTLTVAFKGGDTALHEKIADCVSEWTKYANLKFDFGKTEGGTYRKWSPSDKEFAAQIRVSFDQSGYYSLVGNDSIDKTVTKTGEESLNLEGFDQQLPGDWKAVAQHEFGHAIGFEHEHQSPVAPCDFRFDDDADYVPTTDAFGQFVPDPQGRRPGLYTLLGGPPNNWPQAVVDFNLKQLPESHAYEVGPFDKESIMKYFFESWMFVSGENSACYTSKENLVISAGDKNGAAKVYPGASAEIAAVTQARTEILQGLVKSGSVPADAKAHFQQSLNTLQDR
jgi:hypothetical protein